MKRTATNKQTKRIKNNSIRDSVQERVTKQQNKEEEEKRKTTKITATTYQQTNKQ